MPKKVVVGVVIKDKLNKTRRVEVQRLVKHRKYQKYLRRRTICHVHDENNEAGAGDTVEIIECRPRSKTKRWELVKVLRKSTAVDVVAMRAAARNEARELEAAAKAAPAKQETPETEATETEATETETPETEAPEQETPETEATETEATSDQATPETPEEN